MTDVMEREVDLEERLKAGTKIEVRNRFDASWSRGFEIARKTKSGYKVRRLSDNEVLPTEFAPEDVRRERRRGMWWY
jgi:hypothetical protein